MTYVVTDNCIRCKYMDCVDVCPVDCFHELEAMLVIDPEACIDCGVCEPECPVEAIRRDGEDDLERWIGFAREQASLAPVITRKGEPPADADEWAGRPGKFEVVFGRPL